MKLWIVTWTGLGDETIVHAANEADALRVAGITPDHRKNQYAIEEIPTSDQPSIVWEYTEPFPDSRRNQW